VPFADLLIPRFGADAIWWSFPMGTITSAALASLYYRFGGWRKSRFLETDVHGSTSDTGVGAPVADGTDQPLTVVEGLAAEG
jgi:hypothetical protein